MSQNFLKLRFYTYSLILPRRLLKRHYFQISLIIFVLSVNPFGNCYLNITDSEAAAVDKPQLTNQLSVAVLPFDNLTGDTGHEYLSDGITDGVIEDLSRIRDLLVIARNSTYSFKGKFIPNNQIAEQLGVRYLLKGGFETSDRRIRINVNLFDAGSGKVLWDEKYEGQFEDVLVIQDKIYRGVISTLNLSADSKTRFFLTHSIQAYDAYIRGLKYYYENTPANWAEAIKLFKKAIEINPNYVGANALIASSYLKSSAAPKFLHDDLPSYTAIALWQKPRILARKYLDLAMKNPTCTSCQVGSLLSLFKRDYDGAIALAEKAIDLNPNCADGYFTLSYIMAADGKPDIAMRLIDMGKRIDPLNISTALYLQGLIRFSIGEMNEAIHLIENALSKNPSLSEIVPVRAAAYAHLGDLQSAAKILKNFQKSWTRFFHLRDVMGNFPFKDPNVSKRLAEGLIKAGMTGNRDEYYKILPGNKLGATDIKNQVFSKKVRTIDYYGKPYIVSRDADGKSHRQMAPDAGVRFDDEGMSWIENDMLCERWNIDMYGVQQCMTIFRNPDYPTKAENEYIIVSDFEVRPLSIEKN